MKCFNHNAKDAIGFCKACGKALCEECVVEIPKGLACKNLCEENAKAIVQLIQYNIEAHARREKARNSIMPSLIISILVGLILVLLFLISGFNIPTLIFAILFVFSIINLILFMRKRNHKISANGMVSGVADSHEVKNPIDR